jgi:hypothetical protein
LRTRFQCAGRDPHCGGKHDATTLARLPLRISPEAKSSGKTVSIIALACFPHMALSFGSPGITRQESSTRCELNTMAVTATSI